MEKVRRVRTRLGVSRLYFLFGFFGIVYFVLIFMTSPEQALFGSSHAANTGGRMLSMAIRLPLELIWLIALYCYLTFAKYVRPIRNSLDGLAFDSIKNGMLALTIGMPLSYIVTNVTSLMNNQGTLSDATRAIVTTYLSLVVQLVAFIFIARGAYILASKIQQHPRMRVVGLAILAGITVGVTYCFLLAGNVVNHHTAQAAGNVWNHLPAWWVIVSVVIPYLFAWTVGARGVYDLLNYQLFVTGRLYKQSLELLAYGLALVILVNMGLQFILSASRQSLHLSTATVFFTAYIFYAIICLGYVLIAIGARRLSKIEEA